MSATFQLQNPNKLIHVGIELEQGSEKTEIIFGYKPLSLEQKTQIASLFANAVGLRSLLDGASLLIAQNLKSMECSAKLMIPDENDELVEFKLEYTEKGNLTHFTMEVLGQLPVFAKLQSVVLQSTNGAKDQFWEKEEIRDKSGEVIQEAVPLAGVRIVKKEKK